MKIIIYFTALFCAINLSIIVCILSRPFYFKSISAIKYAKIKIEKKHRLSKALNKREIWLKQMGVSFMIGKNMNVYTFECIRFIFGVVFGIAFFTVFVQTDKVVWNITFALLMIYAGSFIPVWFLNISNDMDNTVMLEDIKLIYDTLKIQSKAGVFITDILTECYFLIKMPRLKSGVRELANHIYTRHDLQQGLEEFDSKFKNVYIDMLVMTLEQSIKSGQTVQMFNDIAQQIQDVEQALYQKEKRRAENKMLAYQLAVYFAILMVVVYAMFAQLLKAFAF